MRTPSLLRVASISGLATSLFVSSASFAQDAPPTAAPAPGPGAPAAAEEPARFRALSVTLNPLGIGILGRYGANVEYMVAKHHGVWIYPFFTSYSAKIESGTSKTEVSNSGFGGELGYHFYTGQKGANGFYVGPTVGLSRVTSKSECTGCQTNEDTATATHIGIDLGGQHVFDNGITLGGGGGLMRYVSSSDTKSDSTFTKFSGTLPRFLFTVGYSF